MPYATIQDLRDEGVTTEEATDARLQDLIDEATEYIDNITGRWFEPRTKTLKLDGTGHDFLWLAIPIISINQVTVDGRQLETSEYTAYDRPDDRNNPKIVGQHFPEGNLNVEVAGEFGYVEETTGTPRQIKRACRMLVIREIPKLTDIEGQEEKKRSRIVSETTDGHSYTLSEAMAARDFTGEPDIDNILWRYKAPPGVGSV